jgi:glycosyltransferase involved in cell wall biosynthesis
MKRKKLLFVVGGFYRAGAERFMYELDSNLDKENYDVTILSLEKKSKIIADWGSRYYEQKHLDLNSKVHFIDSFLMTKNLYRRVKAKFYKVFLNEKYQHNIDPYYFNDFVSHFDLINWIGEYTYFHNLSLKNSKKSLIYIMSGKFQNPSLYKDFDFEKEYNFVSTYFDEEIKYELSQFSNYKHYFLPLLLKIPFEKNNWFFKDSDIKKIGIFTRLNHYKPLDPFFYAFHLLLDKIPNCELYIYGNGDPEKAGVIRYLKNLGIQKKVFFKGHQEDIVHTLINGNINLTWFQGYNNSRPAGYAGLDISTTGTPLICWDFMEFPNKSFNEIYPHYKNLNHFVYKSYEILTNKQLSEELSQFQFKDVNLNKNIDKNIYRLYEIYNQFLN